MEKRIPKVNFSLHTITEEWSNKKEYLLLKKLKKIILWWNYLENFFLAWSFP